MRIFCKRSVSHVSGWEASGSTKTHKVDADGGDVTLGVGVVGESEQETGLSDSGISDKEELKEVVVSARVIVSMGDEVLEGRGGSVGMQGGNSRC